MKLEFIVAFSIIYFVLWTLFYVFLKLNYRNKFLCDFSLKRTFTFETHNFESRSNILLRIGFIFFSCLGIIPFIYFVCSRSMNYTIDYLLIACGGFLVFTIIFKILLFFTKTFDIKFFIKEYVARLLTLGGVLVSGIAGIMITISENKRLFYENSAVLRTFWAIFIIIALIVFSCLFNKKFYKWYHLENENGELKKPNTIYICLYEWIFDFAEIFAVILFTIFMYFMV